MDSFVGAGPGASDLITVRGLRALSSADIIIYAGSLVNPELLNYKNDKAEVFNSAGMTLEEVTAVMEKNKDKLVVRLHTGDPSMYGAIREQMDFLDEKNIPYDVVPGVSSVFGAASSLKAEFTLPDVSQTLILTRMAGRTPVPENESIEKLASHGASMAVFLSAGMLDELSEKLILGGYEKNTPAAIVYKATWEDEKLIRTTVQNLKKSAVQNNISKTALILVGDFLGDTYSRSKLYDPSFTHEFRDAKK